MKPIRIEHCANQGRAIRSIDRRNYVTTSYAAPSMAPAFPNEAANAVDQYEAVAEAVNGGPPTNSALAYDIRGNLVSDTVSTYTYDLENRMLTATAAGTSCASGCSYTYDPMGRRIAKTVGATVTKFLRAGSAEIAEYDNSGNLLRRYVPGAGPDTFVVWIEGTGTMSASMKWILADRQGSVAVVTDNSGKVTQRFSYDPFGNEIAGAPGTGFPFRYTGQRFDPETDLYYYKARYYSAKLGRFLQTDPVGYEDQLIINLYTYVWNDPLNKTDPTGEVRIGININIKIAIGPKGFRLGINLNYDTESKEVGGSLKVGYRAGAQLEAKGEVYVEPSSTQGAEIKGEVKAIAEAGIEAKVILANGEATAEITAGGSISSKDGAQVNGPDVDGSAGGNLGPGSVDNTGRVTFGIGGSVGVSAGVDAEVSANIPLDRKERK